MIFYRIYDANRIYANVEVYKIATTSVAYFFNDRFANENPFYSKIVIDYLRYSYVMAFSSSVNEIGCRKNIPENAFNNVYVQ